ncbi:Transposase [Nitrococcus mobilis Nb-231]|uniref:Transposase n=1 Tax=Nitrococcus mobilis Nb-231 TaxID=314278 RepID=A4BP46_9GAMM|nr:Transposase [Nitrococcus mobilis Nb-231]EAR22347.1 Transposase [Nitrococcus mobilis Nb-231]
MVKKYKVTLQAEERQSLEAMTQKGSHQSRKVINALILLNCDEGEFNQRRLRGEDVAEVLKVSLRRLDRVKKRFVEEGLETALGGRPRQRQYERKADGDLEARLVALSCSEPPKGYSQWSLRLLADRAVELEYVDSLSYETVRRVLKKTKSNPGGGSVG